MDLFICNKCFIPIYRGHRPYNITQCGHIFCQKCVQQVERQCPRCQYISPAYIPLKDLMPTTISFFEPVNEIWDMLSKADNLRTDQMKIIMQRFHEIEEKYEKLKSHMPQVQHNFKILRERYINLKNETEKARKKLLQMQNTCKMQNNQQSVFCKMNAPIDSNSTRIHLSSTGCASASVNSSKFSNAIPKYQIDADGFRVPNPKSGNSLFKKDMSSNYSFMK